MKPATRVALVGMAVLLAMVGLFALRPAILDQAELVMLDWRFRVRGPRPPRTPVAIIAIDEKSIDELGRWPWRRSVIAELIDRLSEAGVAGIGLDIVFSEPERTPETAPLQRAREALLQGGDEERSALSVLDAALRDAATDAQLEAALEASDRTVLGYFFRTAAPDANVSLSEAATDRLRRSRVAVSRVPADSRAPVLTCSAVEPNLKRFHDAARRAGFFSALRDRDGVVRRAPLVARCGDDFYVALSLALVEVVGGKRAMVLGDESTIQVVVGGEPIPTDEGGRVLVNYRGPAGTFPQFSASDILRGRIAPEALQGLIALVGPTEPGIMDIQSTPFGRAVPGVEIHANVIDDILSGEILRRDDRLVMLELALVLALGLAVILVVPRLGGAARGALFVAFLGTVFVAACVSVFSERGLWIQMAYPGMTLIAVYAAVAITQTVTVEARSRMIRRAFATYVPPEVVNEMVRAPERLTLGGERRDLSLLFSDVRDFTTLSEALGAENTARLMNEYLTPMTRIVFRSRGTLDKYIGDAIVAFWGAPLEVPDHPVATCEAAIAMQSEIEKLRRDRSDLAGADRLKVGIGIHSAEVVVGNLGSELRFDYTVTGDGVNLCSRLEGMTKFYGIGIAASEALVRRLPPGFLTREIDTIRVKGRQEGVGFHQVLGRRDASAEERALLEGYAQGLADYRAGRWAEAERTLEETRRAAGGDGPSELLLGRIRSLERKPPTDWQGVWTFESK